MDIDVQFQKDKAEKAEMREQQTIEKMSNQKSALQKRYTESFLKQKAGNSALQKQFSESFLKQKAAASAKIDDSVANLERTHAMQMGKVQKAAGKVDARAKRFKAVASTANNEKRQAVADSEEAVVSANKELSRTKRDNCKIKRTQRSLDEYQLSKIANQGEMIKALQAHIFRPYLHDRSDWHSASTFFS